MPPNLFQCAICAKSFPDPKLLLDHVSNHASHERTEESESEIDSEEEMDCPSFDMEKFLKNMEKYAVHSKKLENQSTDSEIAHKKKLHECEVCGKAFTVKGQLNRHLKIHSGIKPFKCDFCNKKFVHHFQKIVHEKTHQGPVVENQCRYCQKLFERDDHKVSHERVHTGERPYKCSYCPKTFSQKSHKKRHEMIHTGQKPFQRKFTRKRLCKDHESTHPTE